MTKKVVHFCIYNNKNKNRNHNHSFQIHSTTKGNRQFQTKERKTQRVTDLFYLDFQTIAK